MKLKIIIIIFEIWFNSFMIYMIYATFTPFTLCFHKCTMSSPAKGRKKFSLLIFGHLFDCYMTTLKMHSLILTTSSKKMVLFCLLYYFLCVYIHITTWKLSTGMCPCLLFWFISKNSGNKTVCLQNSSFFPLEKQEQKLPPQKKKPGCIV